MGVTRGKYDCTYPLWFVYITMVECTPSDLRWWFHHHITHLYICNVH